MTHPTPRAVCLQALVVSLGRIATIPVIEWLVTAVQSEGLLSVLRLLERRLLKIARIPRHALSSFPPRVISVPKGQEAFLQERSRVRPRGTNGVHTPADVSRVTHAMSWRQDHHAVVRFGPFVAARKNPRLGHTCYRGHFHDVNPPVIARA